MEITEINISLRNEDKLKAFVNVTFDDEFVVRGMKVIRGSSGYFISMPSRKMPDGSYRDIAHPIRNEFRQYVEKEILEEYRTELEKEGGDLSDLTNALEEQEGDE
ncbi:septation protein SpoVG [candidate division KSB1 bacterium]|nr:septation protein SpoVG [candidate division KSB1 bacterium]NIR69912.1 septation protein SpoVG [candidate division KSB1 bacterium]NIS25821.1 septation protein SpoVG [candidate division KSB1 bacterium]NIT72696.1 septation protein SpoVG [candidate division KSB1 bacterium]NIU26510.1 septation protein SpoVG [candidate division KSB1 bacterium]